LINVKQISWFDDHFYEVTTKDGAVAFLPSVTTILSAIRKPQLERWRGEIGNREADLIMHESADRGSRIHYAWNILSNKGIVIFNPYFKPNYTDHEILALKEKYKNNVVILQKQDEMLALVRLKMWANVTNANFLFSEMIVYSLEKGYAGTLDNIAFIEKGNYEINGSKPLYLEGGNYLIDLKSGSAVYDEHYIQVSSYKEAVEEMGLLNIAGALIVHTSAQTKKGIEGLATHLVTREEMDTNYKIFLNTFELWKYKNANSKPKVFDFPSMIVI